MTRRVIARMGAVLGTGVVPREADLRCDREHPVPEEEEKRDDSDSSRATAGSHLAWHEAGRVEGRVSRVIRRRAAGIPCDDVVLPATELRRRRLDGVEIRTARVGARPRRSLDT